MDIKNIDKLILVFVILAILSLNYSAIDKFLEKTFLAKSEVFVERIIDGDTIESNMGNIRLLGINTPERKEQYYEEAKEFLGLNIFNKTIQLEFGKDRRDKYNRTLAYLFFQGRNINVEMVENGFANYYFYDGRDKYSDELEDAWQICLNNRINLCEPSKHICSSCINVNSTFIVNPCSFSCDVTNWTIKGEGRDKVIFNQTIIQPNGKAMFKLDLANSGGSLFLRDREGKLVVWKNY